MLVAQETQRKWNRACSFVLLIVFKETAMNLVLDFESVRPS